MLTRVPVITRAIHISGCISNLYENGSSRIRCAPLETSAANARVRLDAAESVLSQNGSTQKGTGAV